MTSNCDAPSKRPTWRIRDVRCAQFSLGGDDKDVDGLLERGCPRRFDRQCRHWVVLRGDNACPVAWVWRFQALNGDGSFNDITGQQDVARVDVVHVACVNRLSFDQPCHLKVESNKNSLILRRIKCEWKLSTVGIFEWSWKLWRCKMVSFFMPPSLSCGYPRLFDPPFGSFFDESNCLLLLWGAFSRGN